MSNKETLDLLAEAIAQMQAANDTDLNEETITGGTGDNPQANFSGPPADENLSLPEMYHQLKTPSLAKSVLYVQRLHGPTGALFNIKKKDDEDEIEIVRSEVEVEASKPIKTQITVEAIEDIKSQFGISGVRSVAIMLRGLANDQENDKLIEWLDEVAVSTTSALTLTNASNALDNYNELNQFVSRAVLGMNMKGLRTYHASVILPFNMAASSLGMAGSLNKETADICQFYVGGTGMFDYFVHPDPEATKGYIILHDLIEPTKSAGVFAPYTDDMTSATDFETGEPSYFIYNRFAIEESPLHTDENPMILSFDSPI